MDELCGKIVAEAFDGSERIVREGFEEKIKEYSNLVAGKPEMFSTIFGISKEDFPFPIRGKEEKLESYLSRSQQSFNQLSREVEIVKDVTKKHEKLEKMYEDREKFKNIINTDLEQERCTGVRIREEDVVKKGRFKCHLPTSYATEIARELIKEKLERGEYEQVSDGTLYPIVSYRGKKIYAGRFHENYRILNRADWSPVSLRTEDVKVHFCEDIGVFVEWLGCLGLRPQRVDNIIRVYGR